MYTWLLIIFAWYPMGNENWRLIYKEQGVLQPALS